jgi:hypothetical protein
VHATGFDRVRSYAVEENVVEKGVNPPECPDDDYINFVIASP